MLCSLEIENTLIEPSKVLFMSCYSSQTSCAYMCWQLSNKGFMKVISCESWLLKGSDRNRAASHRETLALCFYVIELEKVIGNHPKQCIIITDCISFQILRRLKLINSKFLKFSLYLSTFSNIGVYFHLVNNLSMPIC